MQDMIPYLAAASHNLYTKSIQVYLQNMLQLEQSNPDVYHSFTARKRVIHRSDRFWAGLSTDLIIEQVLMRSVKTTGGLTRGRGMTESQRATWLLSMPACADVNGAMQQFAGSSYTTSEQHKDLRVSRKEQDGRDMKLMLAFLEERDLFSDSSVLKNIATGVVAGPCVNAHKAKEVSEQILKKMTGQKITEHGFKRTDQVATMASKNLVKIDEDVVYVDPQLLFQRLVSAVGNIYEDKSEVFKYELSSYPSSLFESSTFLRQANKSLLADEIWKIVFIDMPGLAASDNLQYVLDGGALLQKIPWSRGSTFASIIGTYVRYITQRYRNPVVVFDGYVSGPSTKDVTHLRRTKGKSSAEVQFTPDMTLQTRKDLFLSNPQNKQRFIDFLSDELQRNSCVAVCAQSDADCMIVAEALESAKKQVTVDVGDNADLLVLLCYHVNDGLYDIFLQPSRKVSLKPTRCWNIKHTQTSPGDLCHLLPFIHAVTGCDTTSRPFGTGKRAVV